MHEKTLIVNDGVGQHESQDGKQQVLWAYCGNGFIPAAKVDMCLPSLPLLENRVRATR